MEWKNKFEELIRKGKGKKDQWLILFLVGILLIVIAVPVEKESTENTEESATNLEYETSENEYVSQMEAQLERVLRKVEGVGEVSVMITISETSEKIIEKDEETSVQTSSGESSGTSSSTDRRETSVYSGSSGSESPYVIKEISPQVEGVVVVAEGGDNAVVIESISEAVQALFGIDPHKIKVMKHN